MGGLTLREIEADSILKFVTESREFLTGNVLDFGCGDQPYRHIVEGAGGVYHPYDRVEFPANRSKADYGWTADDPRLKAYDAVLCTQVIQYIGSGVGLLRNLREVTVPDGYLVLTGPTNWPVVERQDLHRYTPAGARKLVTDAGYRILREIERAAVTFEGERWTVGWAILGRAM